MILLRAAILIAVLGVITLLGAGSAFAAPPTFCGDGIVQAQFSEQCDDGNAFDGDGCESNCRFTLLIPANNCATTSSCTYDGFSNTALGGAQLSLDLGGNLVVSNIGSSGLDGVRQDLPPGAVDMVSDFAVPNFSGSGPGDVLTTRMFGVVNAISGQLFTQVTITNSGTELVIETDMSSVGTTSYTIELFNDRQLVAQETGLATAKMRISIQDIVREDCGIDPNGLIVATGRTPAATSFFIVGGVGGPIVANNWFVTSENFTGTTSEQEFAEMLGTNLTSMPAFGISKELSIPPPGPTDCNADGIADTDLILAICTGQSTIPTLDEQRCINTLNKNFAKVAGVQSRENLSCIRDASVGRLNGTIEDCLTADRRGVVARTQTRAVLSAAKRCTSPASFGPNDAAVANTAAVDKEIDLLHDIFGLSLDGGVIVEQAVNRAAAKCQQAVARTTKRCQDTQLREFNRCKRRGLREGTVISRFSLEQCLGADSRDRVLRSCDASLGRIRRDVGRRCVSRGVDLSDAFPGCGTDDPATLAACLEASLACRACEALNAVDNLESDCDEFDDGVVNGSCP